jgi:DNA-binding transcriptional LysR family regulator
LLRIGAPVLFAPAFVAPVVCDFLERHPGIEIELKVSDRQVDLQEQGLDLAVRIREMPDSQLKARRIGELRVVVFGAPAYFAKHGRPRHPDDLARHHCILQITDDPDVEKWPFRVGGRRKSVGMPGMPAMTLQRRSCKTLVPDLRYRCTNRQTPLTCCDAMPGATGVSAPAAKLTVRKIRRPISLRS